LGATSIFSHSLPSRFSIKTVGEYGIPLQVKYTLDYSDTTESPY